MNETGCSVVWLVSLSCRLPTSKRHMRTARTYMSTHVTCSPIDGCSVLTSWIFPMQCCHIVAFPPHQLRLGTPAWWMPLNTNRMTHTQHWTRQAGSRFAVVGCSPHSLSAPVPAKKCGICSRDLLCTWTQCWVLTVYDKRQGIAPSSLC